MRHAMPHPADSLREDNSGTKQETLYFLQNHSLSLDELNVIAVMDDAAALKRCIALGMGISILSRATVQTDAQQGRLLLFPPRTVSVPAPAVHCVSVHTTYVRAGYSLSGFYKKILSDQMTAVRTDRYTAVLSTRSKRTTRIP